MTTESVSLTGRDGQAIQWLINPVVVVIIIIVGGQRRTSTAQAPISSTSLSVYSVVGHQSRRTSHHIII